MVLLLVTSIKIGIVVCTFVGNLFVIVAILIDKNLQTAGNQLVLSLAVADLMVGCLVMPLGTYNDYHQGWWLGTGVCEFWTCADVLCCTASILNLLAIALDRYWAVTNVDYIYKRTWKRVTMMIMCAWAVGAVVSLAPIFGWKDPDFGRRVLHDHKCLPSQDVGYQIFATISTFYAPLVLLLALYWRIFKVARKRIHCKPGRKSGGPQQLVAAASSSILGGEPAKLGERRRRLSVKVVDLQPADSVGRPASPPPTTTESIARRVATPAALETVAARTGQTELDRPAGSRAPAQTTAPASGESNFEPMANSIADKDVGGVGGDSRRPRATCRRVTNDTEKHNGDGRLKGDEDVARSQVAAARRGATNSVLEPADRRETNDRPASDSMNEKQICSPGDRVLPVPGDGLALDRCERLKSAAAGNKNDQFLSPPKVSPTASNNNGDKHHKRATRNCAKDVRGCGQEADVSKTDAIASETIIERGAVSGRRARRVPPTSADDMLRLLQRCAPNPLRAESSWSSSSFGTNKVDANDRRPKPAPIAAHLELAEGERPRLQIEEGRWKQSGERSSLLQLDVQMLPRELDPLAGRRSASNSPSDCGYCCCCLHGAEQTDENTFTSDDNAEDDDDNNNNDDDGHRDDASKSGNALARPQRGHCDFRWAQPNEPQQAPCNLDRPKRETPVAWPAFGAPQTMRNHNACKQRPPSSLPFTTSMSISSSASSPSSNSRSSSASSSSSSSSSSSASSLSPSSRSMLAAAAAAEIELALDEQIRLEFQFNDELRAGKSKQIPQTDHEQLDSLAVSISEEAGARLAPDGAVQTPVSRGRLERAPEGSGESGEQPEESSKFGFSGNSNNKSHRTSAIRRRFRALGQLVSFVQTSRQFNSSSSTQTSQSGDDEHQRQLPAAEQLRRQPLHEKAAAAAAAGASLGCCDAVANSGNRLNGSESAGSGADRQAGTKPTPTPAVGSTRATPLATLKTPSNQEKPNSNNMNGRQLQSSASNQQQQRRQNLEMKREKKAAKTLAIITGVFVCCWLPFFLNAIVMPICGELCTPSDAIQSVLLWLGYLNSLLNPIIYTIFSPDFRRAFSRLLYWPDAARRRPGACGQPAKKLPTSGNGSAKNSSEFSLGKRKSILSRLT